MTLLHGMTLLRDPLLNKGTAFSESERDRLGLRGLLPPCVSTMQAQADRILTNLRNLPIHETSELVDDNRSDPHERLLAPASRPIGAMRDGKWISCEGASV